MDLNVGDMIPDFLGIGSDGNEVHASDFGGVPLVIYFYPKDNTPGCTAEACSLRDGDAEIAAKGYKVIGISKDSVASHAKFADKYSLPFTLLSDPATEVNQAFGVWQKRRWQAGNIWVRYGQRSSRMHPTVSPISSARSTRKMPPHSCSVLLAVVSDVVLKCY